METDTGAPRWVSRRVLQQIKELAPSWQGEVGLELL